MIIVLTGPEGAGKTLVMTRTCLEHLSEGGKLYTFPGYIVRDAEGTVLSQELSVGEFLEMVLSGNFNNVMLAIDEMQNWFDSYAYNAQLSNIFVAVEAQRRKINLKVVGTVQEFEWLPPRIRRLAHLLGVCNDYYFLTRRKYPQGHRIAVRYCDLKGFITGKPRTWLHPTIINNANRYWQFYDTYAVVDFLEKFTKIKVKKRVIEVDASGNEHEEFTPNAEALANIDFSGNRNDEAAVRYVLSEYEKNKIKEIPLEDMFEAVRSQVDIGKMRLGKIMTKLGWRGKNKTVKGMNRRLYIPTSSN